MSIIDLSFSLVAAKVVEWRKLMGMDPDDLGKVHLDSWGIKRMFTHLLRRWLSGTISPREPFWQIKWL